MNQVLLHCIQIYLRNLAKVKWKIEIYILTFQTPKNNYQKDKCLIQGAFYKGWYIQCHNPNYPQKIIIMDLFLLVELETKFIMFTTTHWSTITLKWKIKQEKVSQKISNENENENS
jgi:hypothetical protein